MENQELPCWLDSIVLTKILKNKFGDKHFKIINFGINCGNTKEGDHYLSEILHFFIEFNKNGETGISHFILKDMDKGLSDFLIDVKGVEKEVGMYKNVLPLINDILGYPVSPKMLYHSSNNCIVLDDLSASGYSVASRITMLDFDHCKSALISLAKLHAGSVMCHKNQPDRFEVVGKETIYCMNRYSIPYYFGHSNIMNAIQMLNVVLDGSAFVGGVEKFLQSFWDDVHYAVYIDFGFNVLNHGDFWTTNILYKYDKGIITDCKLIDFQMTRFCSPTIDLYQFLTISMDPLVRDTRLDELLDVYVDTLNETLSKVGSSASLSRKQLEEQMYNTKAMGLFSALTLTPIALCDPLDPLQLSNIGKSDFLDGFKNNPDPYRKAYYQKRVQDHIISLLKFFRRRNYI